jgi:hypothetical protein
MLSLLERIAAQISDTVARLPLVHDFLQSYGSSRNVAYAHHEESGVAVALVESE